MNRVLLTALVLSAPAVAFLPARFPHHRHASQLSAMLEGREINGALQPLSNFVLVKVREAAAETAGGIVLPDQAKEKPTEGTVISTGPGKIFLETNVEVPVPVTAGQNVLYGKYDGSKVDYDQAEHTLIRDTDILLIYDGDRMTIESATPAWDRILVKVDSSQESTNSGIMLVQSSEFKAKASEGQVVSVGPGRLTSTGDRAPMNIAAGEYVKFREYAGTEIRIEGVDYLVVSLAECLAKWQ